MINLSFLCREKLQNHGEMTPTAIGKNSQEAGQEEDRRLSAVWSILILQGKAPARSPVSLPSVVSYFWHF